VDPWVSWETNEVVLHYLCFLKFRRIGKPDPRILRDLA
jgi:hypothetical protein